MTRQEIETNNEPKATDGKVGYKHPPVKSQFRKGQSGNPRGRRKGQRNLAAVLAEVLRQTVTVKQGGNSQRMSKGDALIQILLTKAHHGDGRAIKAVFLLTEKIGRIENADLKLGGLGNYEFMLVPGIATPEEWQREIAARDQTAALRESIATARATTGTLPTGSQIAALRETIAAACARGTPPTPTRRPVNRIDKSSLKPDPALEQSKGETAAPPQMPTVESAHPSVPTVARTGTYRKVNRRQPAAPTTVPDA
jgi:Family of unknown function (DUF5681)